jgi:2-amino-4-deoxychorismate synthase
MADSPFCIYRRGDSTFLVRGEVSTSSLLSEMPQPGDLPVISIVPYSQLRERGFKVHDEGEQIVSLTADHIEQVQPEELTRHLDREFSVSDVSFDVSDESFANEVHRIIHDEICRGEGSNFLFSRSGRAQIADFSKEIALAIFERLLRNEFGAYMTFCFYDGERYFIGASPERHLTIEEGVVTMNPICGTLLKRDLKDRNSLISFLQDPKEVNELFQVVDEELKMMSRLCPDGGVVRGPFLKEMGDVVHTEYELVGRTKMNVIDAFRDSMFAATMIGSPLENAARVIHRHEKESRRYYSSAIVFHAIEDGREIFDSAITIRSMEVSNNGELLLRSGSSIVRDSSPEAETNEVKAKIAGVLRAITTSVPAKELLPSLVDEEIESKLAQRNETLSSFWLEQQSTPAGAPTMSGRSALVIDNEDEFTFMLGHVLRHLGFHVEIKNFDDADLKTEGSDLVVVGPGPGDPNDTSDAKMSRVHEIVEDLIRGDQPFLAVCLGHQIVCRQLGMQVGPVDPPLQGVQLPIDLYGRSELVGFYNTFLASGMPARKDVEVAQDATGRVMALRSARFHTFQFHLESVLTQNCEQILRESIEMIL